MDLIKYKNMVLLYTDALVLGVTHNLWLFLGVNVSFAKGEGSKWCVHL